MTIDDVIKLVNAGFKADQIAQMYAAEKVEVPSNTSQDVTQSNTSQEKSAISLDNLRSNLSPLPGESTPPITPETQQNPLSVPAEPPKVEEAPTDSNKEIEDLKKQLEASQASVQSLQNLMASVNVAGTAKTETAEDYLKKIFSEMY